MSTLIIGVTGGVGTGKSSILGILKEDYRAQVILADDVAKDLMVPGNKVYNDIYNFFGDEVFTDGYGSPIDRPELSRIVFTDKEKLLKLNSIVHPAVKLEIIGMIDSFKSAGEKMIVIETAILIQAGYLDIIDELWVVHTDYETRVRRLLASRGYSREKTDNIISNQLPDEEMEKMADLVIDNSGSLEYVKEQIARELDKRNYNA